MADRRQRKTRRINKRVAIGLGAAGALVLALVLAVIIRRLPKDPAPFAAAGDAFYEQQRYAAAANKYASAVKWALRLPEERPRVPMYLHKLARAKLQLARSGKLIESERHDHYLGALALLDKAIDVDPSYVDAHRLRCEALWMRIGLQTYERFIKQADRLLELDPADHQAWHRRGLAKAKLSETLSDRTQGALDDLKKAIELKPGNASYRLGLAAFFWRSRRYEQAHQAFREAVRVLPNSAGVRISYADFLTGRAMDAEALAQLERAVALEPDNPAGNIALAVFHLREGKWEQALQAAQAAQKQSLVDFRPYHVMAKAYQRQGKPDKAILVLEEGLLWVGREHERLRNTGGDLLERLRAQQGMEHLNFTLAGLLLDRIGAGVGDRQLQLAAARKCLDGMEDRRPNAARRALLGGRIALAEGKAQEAIQQLEAAWEGFSIFEPQAANILIDLYLKRGMPGRAERVINRYLGMLEGRQADAEQHLLLSTLLTKARLEVRLRRFDEARRIAERVLKSKPPEAGPAWGKIEAEAQQLKLVLDAVEGGRPGDVAKLQMTPEMLGLLQERAAHAWLEDRRAEAIALAAALEQAGGHCLEAVTQLYNMYLMDNQVDRARAVLTEAVAAQEKDPEVRRRLQEHLELLDEPDPAKRFDMRIRAIDARAKQDSPLQVALAKANLCAIYRKDDEYLKYLGQAADIDPRAPGVIQRMLRHATRKEDWPLAETIAARAAQADLDGVGGRTYRARLAVARGKLTEAIATLTEALRLRPELKDARVMLGDCHLALGQLSQAEEAFELVLQDDPGYVPAVVGMLRVSDRQGRTDEIEYWLGRARQLAPASPHVRAIQSRLAEEQASPEQVLTAREARLKADPDDLVNRLQLAMLYERMGRYADAEAMHESIVARSADKLLPVARLAYFHARTQGAEGIRRGAALLARRVEAPIPMQGDWRPPGAAGEKVASHVLYGDFLSRINTPQSIEQAFAQYAQAAQLNPDDHRPLLSRAALAARLGRWPIAIDDMTRVTSLRPDAPAYQRRLIEYLIRGRRFAQARDQIDRMRKNDPADYAVRALEGLLLLGQGEAEKAQDTLRKVVQSRSDYIEGRLFLAGAYLARGEAEQARDELVRAYRLSGQPAVALRLADIHKHLRRFDEVEKVYLDLLAKRPRYLTAYERLIESYLERSAWAPLERLLARARQAFPGDVRFHLAEGRMWKARQDPARQAAALAVAAQMAPDDGQVIAAYMSALVDAGRHAEAERLAKPFAARAEAPIPMQRDWRPPDLAALLEAMLARSLLAQKRPDAADERFAAAIRAAAPDVLPGVLSEVQQAFGPEQAAVKLRSWLALRPQDWRFKLSVARAHRTAGDSEQAVAILRQVLSAFRAPAAQEAANRLLGAIHADLGRHADAEAVYLALLKIKPDDPELLNNLAYVYTDGMKDAAKAEPLARKAVRLWPNNPHALDTCGWTVLQLGRQLEAEQYLMRAIQLKPDSATIRYHLGRLYEAQQSLSEALKQYRNAAELADRNKALRSEAEQAVRRVRAKMDQLMEGSQG